MMNVLKPLAIAAFLIAMLMQSLPAQAGAYNPTRSCRWSITAACAAWRNGGSYTRDGITHVYAGRNPNRSMIIHVYRGNVRVK
jgi:hypothetical protein